MSGIPSWPTETSRSDSIKGALLWLIKSEDGLAGYGWTLQGRTIEPHYFPLASMTCIFSISTCSPSIGVGE